MYIHAASLYKDFCFPISLSTLNIPHSFLSLTYLISDIFLLVPPCRPLNIQLDNITSKSADVLWKSGCDGFSPITSFRLETRTNSSWQKVSDFIKTEYFTIENLRPYTSYNIRVFSKNNIGWSKASESITLRTNEDCEYQTRNIKIVLLRRQC